MGTEPPLPINLPQKCLYFFPSEADTCIAATGDNQIYLSCVIPPSSKTIKYYYSQRAEFEASIPQLLWVHHLKYYEFESKPCYKSEFEIFEFQIKDSQLLKRPYRIGNVNSFGKICWFSRPPLNLRQAHSDFFYRDFSGAYLPRSAFHVM